MLAPNDSYRFGGRAVAHERERVVTEAERRDVRGTNIAEEPNCWLVRKPRQKAGDRFIGTNSSCAFLCLKWEPMTESCVIYPMGAMGFIAMLDRAYLLRQIRTLLKFANQTSDPLFAAFLMEKAVHLKSQVEETPPPKDVSPLPPDVESENVSQ